MVRALAGAALLLVIAAEGEIAAADEAHPGFPEQSREEALKEKECRILQREHTSPADLSAAGCIDAATARRMLLRRLYDPEKKPSADGGMGLPWVLMN